MPLNVPIKAVLNRFAVKLVLSIALTLLLSMLLVAAIYFTGMDLQWLAFLGGVLFAAVLALVSQLSKAKWLALRRSKQLTHVREQLEHAREQMEQEIARSRNTAEALRISEARLGLLGDQMPLAMLYVDRNERCRHHSKACAAWLGLSADRIDGQMLRDIFGPKAYATIASQFAWTLTGMAVDYELAAPDRGSMPTPIMVRQIPYAPDGSNVVGLYLFFIQPSPDSVRQALPERSANTVDNALPGSGDGGEALYLHSISEDLMGGESDARARLERALQQNEFLLFSQKILALNNNVPEPASHEILLRLKEEEDNLLPPGGFFPVAERYGMLEEIDRWVVRNLIAWCLGRQRDAPGWRIPMFSVNLSRSSLDDPDFARFVQQELQRTRFPARALCFEIDDPDIASNYASVLRLVSALKPAGCRFTIDAFGGAGVAFTHLKGLPADFLKIDGNIVQKIQDEPAQLAKVRAINNVCHNIGILTIAECVESEETLSKLRELGVDYVQGFGIARPGPITELS